MRERQEEEKEVEEEENIQTSDRRSLSVPVILS